MSKMTARSSARLVAVRYGWRSQQASYRGLSPKERQKPRRWTVRAQIWCCDPQGRPARFSSTVRMPKAMSLSALAAHILAMLDELAAELRQEMEVEDAADLEHVAAGWIAVSESPKKSPLRSR